MFIFNFLILEFDFSTVLSFEQAQTHTPNYAHISQSLSFSLTRFIQLFVLHFYRNISFSLAKETAHQYYYLNTSFVHSGDHGYDLGHCCFLHDSRGQNRPQTSATLAVQRRRALACWSRTHTHRALHPALLPQNTFTIIHNEIPASFIIAPAHNFNASLLNCEQPCHLTAPIYSDIPVCCATYLGVPRPPPRLTYHDCLFFSCAVRCDHIRPCRRLCHHTYLPLGLTCRNKTHGHSFQRPACYTNASYCFLTQTLEQPPPLLPSFSLSTLNKNRGGRDIKAMSQISIYKHRKCTQCT